MSGRTEESAEFWVWNTEGLSHLDRIKPVIRLISPMTRTGGSGKPYVGFPVTVSIIGSP